jgi:predicted permease
MSSALTLLLTCLVLGFLVARVAKPPPGLPQSLNWWIINIALPALILDLIPSIQFSADLWFLVASMWLVFIGAWFVAARAGRLLGWSPARIGAVVLVAGLGNTAFVGYPLVEALRGRESLALAVVADQAGSFTALAIGGVAVTAVYAGRPLHPLYMLQRMVRFPPFIALCGGILAGLCGDFAPPVHRVLQQMGATLSPLALFTVGMQLHTWLNRSQLGALSLALLWKMLLAPAICYALAMVVHTHGLIMRVGVLQAAMPPMVTAAILADQYALEPPLANAALGIGVLLSFLSVPWLDHLL